MKNLKKIISTVAALALTVSSFSAFAADYSDVADTANYKEAVDAISALGIVQGYTDGTFGPEKEITRAEAAKMVVNVLGPKKTAAAENMAGKSDFADVAGSHWASGYIAQGVALGYINGVGNGNFAPDDNVTFGQMVKMLVSAAGYDRKATLAGGWPNGYISVGGDIDLTDDVNGYAYDQNLTRGDAAILLYNALRTPICEIIGWEEQLTVDANGNLTTVTVPETEVLDGSNNKYEYETLLTTYFDAYEVRGMVTNVAKGKKEATFNIAATDNFDGYYYGNANRLGSQTVIYDGLDLDSLLCTYADAIIRETEDDDFELVSIVPYGRNEIETLDAELYATSTASTIEFYKSASTSKTDVYDLDTTDFDVYVNGKAVAEGGEAAAIATYIAGNDTTEVKLVNTPKANASGNYVIDDKYDYIMLSVGSYAIVSGVEVSETKAKIYFSSYNNTILGNKSELVIDLEDVADGDYDFTLVDMEGNDVEIASLEKNDVLTIFSDFVTGLSSADYANVVVCKDVVEGKVENAKKEDNKWVYTIGDGSYSYYAGVDNGNTSELTVGDEYTLYLDAFGRIVKKTIGATAVNYGVITRVWNNTSTDTDTIRLINAAGEVVSYEAKDATNYATVKAAYDAAVAKTFDKQTVAGTVDADAAVKTMVVTYKLDSKNRIYAVAPVANIAYEANASYSERSNKVGSFKLSDQSVILDLTAIDKNTSDWDGQIAKYGSLTTSSSFVNEENYTVVAAYASQKLSDNSYPFVVVIKGVPGITATAEVCVVDSTGRSTNPADGQVYDSVAYWSGSSSELQYAYFDTTPALKQGDMFVYSTDAEGLVDTFSVLFADADANTAGNQPMIDTTEGIKLSTVKGFTYTQTAGLDWEYGVYTASGIASWDVNKNDGQARVGMGVIVENGDGDITIGKVDADNKTVVANADVIDFADDVAVFVYDVNARSSERVYKSSVGVLNPTFLADQFTADGEIFDWNRPYTDDNGNPATNLFTAVKTVMFKTVDDEITDIMVVLPKEN